MSRNGLTTEQARERSLAAWERRRAEGRIGWTDERRAKFRATLAAKYPAGPVAARLKSELLGTEVAELRAAVEALVARVAELEARPATGELRLVEWRPDHRRHVDGGKPVRGQRRLAGLPKRPRAVA